jgi:hypothetical protein
VRSNATLKVYDEVNLRQADTIFLPGGGIQETPAGRLIIENNASLVQTKDVNFNQNFGDIEMDRVASDMNDLDYIYWSSPVENFDIDDLPNSASYLWDPRAVNTIPGTDGNWVGHNGDMQLGRGYIARVPFGGGNSNFSVTSKFIGRPNNGLVTTSIIQSAGTQDPADRHWNLVGNPYPSAINAEKFLLHNTMLEGAVYVWDSNISSFSDVNPAPFYENFIVNYSDAYITYNSLGAVPADTFDGNIAAGQGFFVKMLESAALTEDLEFRNPMRLDASNAVVPNNDFQRSASAVNNTDRDSNSSQEDKQLLWLSLADQSDQASTTLIGYAPNATNGKDRLFDAYANKGDWELAIHSVLDDNNMVIQGRALPFDDQDVVPIGVQIPQAGMHQIGIDRIEGSIFNDASTNILLEDTYLGITHDLKQSPFSFTAEAGTINDRFVLRYTANQLSVKDKEMMDDFKIYYASQRDKIVIMNPNGFQIESVEVFNMLGQSVKQATIDRQQNYYEIPFNNSQAGAYVLHVRTDRGIQTKKFIVDGLSD